MPKAVSTWRMNKEILGGGFLGAVVVSVGMMKRYVGGSE